MSLVDLFRGMGGYPVGEDTAPQYDWQRNKVASNAFGSIFDTIGSIGSQLTDAWAARDYADKVAAAQAVAYDNARKINQATKESMLMLSDFNSNEMLKNAERLKTYAINLRTSAEQSKSLGIRKEAIMQGEATAALAASGVRVDTGSSIDIKKALSEVTQRETNAGYKDQINKITGFLDQAANQVLQADLTRWSAKERARFLDANADLRLY